VHQLVNNKNFERDSDNFFFLLFVNLLSKVLKVLSHQVMNSRQKLSQRRYYTHVNDLHALDKQLARPRSGSALKDAVFRLM
jgi:hypothetical protein